jgi:hypothetical protein
MHRQKEKAAGMLQTPTTASKELSIASIPTAQKTGKQTRNDYAMLQAKFARLGRVLNRIHRAHDGRITYVVSHGSQRHHYSHLNDVIAHMAALVEVQP